AGSRSWTEAGSSPPAHPTGSRASCAATPCTSSCRVLGTTPTRTWSGTCWPAWAWSGTWSAPAAAYPPAATTAPPPSRSCFPHRHGAHLVPDGQEAACPGPAAVGGGVQRRAAGDLAVPLRAAVPPRHRHPGLRLPRQLPGLPGARADRVECDVQQHVGGHVDD